MPAPRSNNKILPWLSLPLAVAGYFFISWAWTKIAPPPVAGWGTWCGAVFSILCLAIGLKAGLTRAEPKSAPAVASAPPSAEAKKKIRPVVPEEEEEAVEELSSMPPPRCPKCRRQMVLRRAKTGPKAGQQFWGCPAYPKCRGTLAVVIPKQFGR